MGNLEPKRDLTDVRDTVRAYVAHDGRRRRRDSPTTSVRAAASPIGDAGATVRRARARAGRIAQDPALLRPNDVPLLVGDHSRLTADTGWEPQIPFEQTVDDLLDYWRRPNPTRP